MIGDVLLQNKDVKAVEDADAKPRNMSFHNQPENFEISRGARWCCHYSRTKCTPYAASSIISHSSSNNAAATWVNTGTMHPTTTSQAV
mmetsp:Transcript_5729/g.13496  ORF Transcript_5729/g.13496 Transcript_5729/m.13496 type:complete len:88 (+) Transcript_5729:195-458(+)